MITKLSYRHIFAKEVVENFIRKELKKVQSRADFITSNI